MNTKIVFAWNLWPRNPAQRAEGVKTVFKGKLNQVIL